MSEAMPGAPSGRIGGSALLSSLKGGSKAVDAPSQRPVAAASPDGDAAKLGVGAGESKQNHGGVKRKSQSVYGYDPELPVLNGDWRLNPGEERLPSNDFPFTGHTREMCPFAERV